MTYTTRVRLAACSLLLAAPLALTACGGDSSDQPSSQPATAAQTSSAPEGIASGEPNPGATSGSTEDSKTKPSKSEVSAGLKDAYDKRGGKDSSVLNTTKLSDCIADKAYDTTSNKTLNALKDGRLDDVDAADTDKLAGYTKTCAKSAAKIPG
ncbi:hypothetical protein PZ938_15820 [Luteipulveratus sp. YIM 133132]|uniref:hypothetical protein n=1 Tax=Luteipulveratus flavus TaxID=3031728 RepID=UPI0023B0BD9A|nr:hypothetical protein [Luteipulveratus sp. YIM 133132]MDE9367085.1 hypothetical protein [Luteipulveratus sp. YIM 133132]